MEGLGPLEKREAEKGGRRTVSDKEDEIIYLERFLN